MPSLTEAVQAFRALSEATTLPGHLQHAAGRLRQRTGGMKANVRPSSFGQHTTTLPAHRPVAKRTVSAPAKVQATRASWKHNVGRMKPANLASH